MIIYYKISKFNFEICVYLFFVYFKNNQSVMMTDMFTYIYGYRILEKVLNPEAKVERISYFVHEFFWFVVFILNLHTAD